MRGKIVYQKGIHTIACVRVGRKHYHATYYRVGSEDLLESLRYCDKSCPQETSIPPEIVADIRQSIDDERVYRPYPRLAPEHT